MSSLTESRTTSGAGGYRSSLAYVSPMIRKKRLETCTEGEEVFRPNLFYERCTDVVKPESKLKLDVQCNESGLTYDRKLQTISRLQDDIPTVSLEHQHSVSACSSASTSRVVLVRTVHAASSLHVTSRWRRTFHVIPLENRKILPYIDCCY